MTAAEQLLREQGFARMTTNRIAIRAGVSVALVYRYFAGKEAIVAALIERFSHATLAGFDAALAAHRDARFPTLIRALLQVLVATPGIPELHRELFEHIDVTKQRAQIRALTAAMTESMSATHAAVFYRPADLSQERVIEALAGLIERALLPVSDRLG